MAAKFLSIFLLLLITYNCNSAKVEDNEFAEFEEDETFEELLGDSEMKQSVSEEDTSTDSMEEQFDSFSDNFEEDEEDDAIVEVEEDEDLKDSDTSMKGSRTGDIKLTQSNVRVSHKFHQYVTEMLIIGGMVVYLLNYFYGRSKNATFAEGWYVGYAITVIYFPN